MEGVNVMQFTFAHNNFNVLNLEKSLAFYKETLQLTEARRYSPLDGSFESFAQLVWIAFPLMLILRNEFVVMQS